MANDTCLLVATVENEGPNVLEWIAYHRLCGFERIQIHQGACADTTVRSLRLLDRLGIIEFHQLSNARNALHRHAYRQAASSETFARSDWCMALDIDEFLHVKTGGGRFSDLISASPNDADAILVNRRIFGSSGHRNLSDDLVTERFIRTEPAHDIVDGRMSLFKSLFRTSAWQRPGFHLPLDPKRENPVLCNGSGLRDSEFVRKNRRSRDPLQRRFAQVNHYALRDIASFLLNQAGTDSTDTNAGVKTWRMHDKNEEVCTGLADRAADTWAEMRRLDYLAEGKLMHFRERANRQWRHQLKEVLSREGIANLNKSLLSESAPASTQGQGKGFMSRTPFRLPGALKSKTKFSSSRRAAKAKASKSAMA